MEFHFSKQQQTPTSKRTNFKARNNNKFIGVRQRPSGRWVAEIKDTTQKIRMWLGTFETAEEAAHAYDEAACLLRGSNTRTNFTTIVSSDSLVSSRIRKMLNQKMDSKKSLATSTKSARIYSNVAPTISTGTCSSTSGPCQENEKAEKNEEEVYRPCIMNESDEYELCGSSSLVYDSGFELPSFDELDTCKRNFFEESTMISSELDRMKVERQISASLYAMNGIQEYLDAVNVASDSFWDLPPLYKLCWS